MDPRHNRWFRASMPGLLLAGAAIALFVGNGSARAFMRSADAQVAPSANASTSNRTTSAAESIGLTRPMDGLPIAVVGADSRSAPGGMPPDMSGGMSGGMPKAPTTATRMSGLGRTAPLLGESRERSGQPDDVSREPPAKAEADESSTVYVPLRALMLTDRSIVIHELPQPVAMPLSDRIYPAGHLTIEITDLAGACYIQAESAGVRLNGGDLKIGQPCLVQPGSVVTWSEDAGIRFSPGSHPGNVPANG